ncbi:serine hydrolase [Massilia sp. TSP1-1-2]|uniref:serine hydrolase n=1 Tax=Massilia sp. TSP1-1-2 TaxID=2804649 RepID=UPI003CEF2EE5
MLKLSPLCLAALLLLQLPLAAVHAAPVAAVVDQALAARIDALVAPYYKPGQPGATLIVVKNGKTLLRKAYGMADVEHQVAMRPEATLRLGSITKQFTAVAIMMLADEGKLATTDPITKFLPDYPTQGKVITIEHLLTHTSGIVSYTGKPDFRTQSLRDVTVPQMIDYFKNDPIEFTPGTKHEYNNSGYFLLGAIIEKLSGQSYAKFVEQRIFIPLGMTHTAYEGHERAVVLRAAGHEQTPAGFGPSQPLSMSQPYAAGSLVSTVDDLAKWDAAISAGTLLKPASWKQAFTPYILANGTSTGYAYGWAVGKLRGSQAVSHGGGINGFSTYAVRLPAEKVYVALLTNSDSGMPAPSLVARQAAAVAIGKPFPEYKAIVLGAAALDAFDGSYKVDEKSSRVVRREGDRLLMQRTGRGAVELIPFSPDNFFVKESTDTFTFHRNAQGQVDQVTLHADDADIVFPRTGAAPAPRVSVTLGQAALDTFVGRYELKPGFVLALTRDGDQLFGQATGQPRLLLTPVSRTTFYVKEIDGEIRFDAGNAQLTLLQGGRAVVAKRL